MGLFRSKGHGTGEDSLVLHRKTLNEALHALGRERLVFLTSLKQDVTRFVQGIENYFSHVFKEDKLLSSSCYEALQTFLSQQKEQDVAASKLFQALEAFKTGELEPIEIILKDGILKEQFALLYPERLAVFLQKPAWVEYFKKFEFDKIRKAAFANALVPVKPFNVSCLRVFITESATQHLQIRFDRDFHGYLQFHYQGRRVWPPDYFSDFIHGYCVLGKDSIEEPGIPVSKLLSVEKPDAGGEYPCILSLLSDRGEHLGDVKVVLNNRFKLKTYDKEIMLRAPFPRESSVPRLLEPPVHACEIKLAPLAKRGMFQLLFKQPFTGYVILMHQNQHISPPTHILARGTHPYRGLFVTQAIQLEVPIQAWLKSQVLVGTAWVRLYTQDLQHVLDTPIELNPLFGLKNIVHNRTLSPYQSLQLHAYQAAVNRDAIRLNYSPDPYRIGVKLTMQAGKMCLTFDRLFKGYVMVMYEEVMIWPLFQPSHFMQGVYVEGSLSIGVEGIPLASLLLGKKKDAAGHYCGVIRLNDANIVKEGSHFVDIEWKLDHSYQLITPIEKEVLLRSPLYPIPFTTRDPYQTLAIDTNPNRPVVHVTQSAPGHLQMTFDRSVSLYLRIESNNKVIVPGPGTFIRLPNVKNFGLHLSPHLEAKRIPRNRQGEYLCWLRLYDNNLRHLFDTPFIFNNNNVLVKEVTNSSLPAYQESKRALYVAKTYLPKIGSTAATPLPILEDLPAQMETWDRYTLKLSQIGAWKMRVVPVASMGAVKHEREPYYEDLLRHLNANLEALFKSKLGIPRLIMTEESKFQTELKFVEPGWYMVECWQPGWDLEYKAYHVHVRRGSFLKSELPQKLFSGQPYKIEFKEAFSGAISELKDGRVFWKKSFKEAFFTEVMLQTLGTSELSISIEVAGKIHTQSKQIEVQRPLITMDWNQVVLQSKLTLNSTLFSLNNSLEITITHAGDMEVPGFTRALLSADRLITLSREYQSHFNAITQLIGTGSLEERVQKSVKILHVLSEKHLKYGPLFLLGLSLTTGKITSLYPQYLEIFCCQLALLDLQQNERLAFDELLAFSNTLTHSALGFSGLTVDKPLDGVVLTLLAQHHCLQGKGPLKLNAEICLEEVKAVFELQDRTIADVFKELNEDYEWLVKIYCRWGKEERALIRAKEQLLKEQALVETRGYLKLLDFGHAVALARREHVHEAREVAHETVERAASLKAYATAMEHEFNEREKGLREQLSYCDELEAQQRNARRRSKRKKWKKIAVVAGGVLLAAVGAHFATTALFGELSATTATLTLVKAAVFEGIVFGGLSSAMLGGNVFKGMLEGGAFATAAFTLGNILEKATKFSKENLRIIQATQMAAVSSVIHHNSLLENVGASALGAWVGNLFVPFSDTSSLSDALSLKVQTNEALRRELVTGGVIAAIKPEAAGNVLASLLASSSQTLASYAGRQVGTDLATRYARSSESQSVRRMEENRGFAVAHERSPERKEPQPGFRQFKGAPNASKPPPNRFTLLEDELHSAHQRTKELLMDYEFQQSLSHQKSTLGSFMPQSERLASSGVMGENPDPKRMMLLWNASKQRSARSSVSAISIPVRSALKPSTFRSYVDTLQQGATEAIVDVLGMFSGEAQAPERMQNSSDSHNKNRMSTRQKNNRDRMPVAAAFFDGNQQIDELFKEGLVRPVRTLGRFLGEEVGRWNLGEQTQTSKGLEVVTTFIAEERIRRRLGVPTVTGEVAMKAYNALSDEKFAGKVLVWGYNKAKGITPENIALFLGESVGSGLAGFGLLKTGSVVTTVGIKAVQASSNTVARGVQLTYRWNLANQSAREAFAGGKYAGHLPGFRAQGIRQLNKSIRSYDRLIREHEAWIKNPSAKCKDWFQRTPENKEALLEHWREDIQRAATYKVMVKRVLKEKVQQGTTSYGGLKDVSKKL